MPKEEPEPPEPAERPAPYPLDHALESAFSSQGLQDETLANLVRRQVATEFDWNNPDPAPPYIGHTPDGDEYQAVDDHDPASTASQTVTDTVTATATAAGHGHRSPGHGVTVTGHGSVLPGPPVTETSPPARGLETVTEPVSVPETLGERLQELPQWQAGYVLALMELGGNVGLACIRCRVSRRSVQKASEASANFAQACREAVDHSTDLVEGAVVKAATVGDLKPKYHQGFIVGYDRVRSTQDARLALELRGRLNRGHKRESDERTVTVPKLANDELPELLARTLASLYGSNRGRGTVIDAEEV